MSPYSEFALSASEAGSGLILACRSVPWSDCEIGWLGEDDRIVHPNRDMNCMVREVRRATHDITIIRVQQPAEPMLFSAGQYAELEFAGLPLRQYSMGNQPGEELLEFHVRSVANGRVSNFVNGTLAANTPVRVIGPGGTAYLRPKHRGPILAIAGGSGLAPVKSIVETALAEGRSEPIHCYFGVRSERDVYQESEFAALAATHSNFKFQIVLSEPGASSSRRTGFVTDAVRADLPNLEGFKTYFCGPPPMVEAAQRLARELGAAPDDIHADAFYTEAEKARGGISS